MFVASLDSFQQIHVLLMLGATGLDVVFQEGSHQNSHRDRAEGQNPLPHPLPMLLWMQHRTRLAFWAASAHCESCWVYQPTTPSLSLQASLEFSAQPVFVLGIVPTQVPWWILWDLHRLPLKPIQVSLDIIPSIQHVDCTTHVRLEKFLSEEYNWTRDHYWFLTAFACSPFLLPEITRDGNC